MNETIYIHYGEDKFIPEKNNKSENNYDEIIDYL